MQLDLPNTERVEIRFGKSLDDDEFSRFCAVNTDLRIERDIHGAIFVIPLGGFETACRSSDVGAQLGGWARADGKGVAIGSNTNYFLPNGAVRAPYASWVLKSRLAGFTREQKRGFLRLCPDFVVELTSPSDPLDELNSKMREWVGNGAQLGWLIDGDQRTVYSFRPGREPHEYTDFDHIAGEGPVAGFILQLNEVWQGV